MKAWLPHNNLYKNQFCIPEPLTQFVKIEEEEETEVKSVAVPVEGEQSKSNIYDPGNKSSFTARLV